MAAARGWCHSSEAQMRAIQGPLITDGRNSCKWTGLLIVLAKTFIMEKFMVKIFEKYFLMDSFIDRRGYRSHFLHQIVATL